MNALETAIEVLEVSQADISEPSDGYCSGEYEVKLKIGEHELTVDGWCVCGWLAPGAHADLDGSGLANWGSSQAGGWRVCDGDGSFSGRVRVRDKQSPDYCDPVHIGAEHVVGADITPDMVPEWLEILESLDEESDGYDEAVEAAEAMRESIVERLVEVLDDYEIDCPEPDAESVYNSLDEIEGIECLPIRFGNYKGAGPVLAWTDGSDYDMDYHPDSVPSRLRDLLTDKIEEIIKHEIAGNNE